MREATLIDMPRIVEMGMKFLEQRPNGLCAPGTPERVERAVNICLDTGIVLVATESDLAAGSETSVGMFCAYTMEHPLTGETIAEELAWYVDPDALSFLAGPRMLRAGIDWARQVGVSCLRMNAPIEGKVGLFLERQGFTPVETIYTLRF